MIRKIFLLFLWVYLCSTADVKSRYYPRYHLALPYGWMNDPNGFSIFKGEYHLFYQYDPDTSHKAGSIHWGHAKSTDLMSWEHLPIAMYPNQSYDSGGVFSGSAIVEDDTMYLYYTAHVNHPGEIPDHEESQALATSTDGVNVTKYANNPIIVRSNLQPDIRDPKVWKHDDTYYMVLGHSINGTTGSILLFTSQDKYNWEQASVLAVSNGALGYMFECPDFFEVDGRFVLLFSPQGIEAQGDDYKNLYQTAYIVGSFDYETNQFTQETALKELDHGHDIYATQTIDDNGRRVVIAWMDMWSTGYPEQDDGFNGCMTLPRVLSLDRGGNLIQTPIKQVKKARGQVVYTGIVKANKSIVLNDKAGEIYIRSSGKTNLEVSIGVAGDYNSTSKVTLTYDPKEGTVTLDRGGEDGIRRTHWKPKKHKDLRWNIFVDASSIELFCGSGEVTFTSRFFLDGPLKIRVNSSRKASVKVTSLRRTVPVPSDY